MPHPPITTFPRPFHWRWKTLLFDPAAWPVRSVLAPLLLLLVSLLYLSLELAFSLLGQNINAHLTWRASMTPDLVTIDYTLAGQPQEFTDHLSKNQLTRLGRPDDFHLQLGEIGLQAPVKIRVFPANGTGLLRPIYPWTSLRPPLLPFLVLATALFWLYTYRETFLTLYLTRHLLRHGLTTHGTVVQIYQYEVNRFGETSYFRARWYRYYLMYDFLDFDGHSHRATMRVLRLSTWPLPPGTPLTIYYSPTTRSHTLAAEYAPATTPAPPQT